MESSYSGNFSDYDISTSNQVFMGSNGQENLCEKAYGNILLEEISSCKYFTKYNSIEIHKEIYLDNDIKEGRLTIRTKDENLSIGFLPSNYNHLFKCIKSGFVFNGIISQYRKVNHLNIVYIDLLGKLNGNV